MDTPDQRIGVNLQRLRKGISQRELAQRMKARGWKWSHVTVGMVEKGERPLRLAEAQDVASALDTSLDQLLLDSSTAEIEMQLAQTASAFGTMRRWIGLFMREQALLAAVRPNIKDERLAKSADGWIATRPEDNVTSLRRELGLENIGHDFSNARLPGLVHLGTSEESDSEEFFFRVIPDEEARRGEHHPTTER